MCDHQLLDGNHRRMVLREMEAKADLAEPLGTIARTHAQLDARLLGPPFDPLLLLLKAVSPLVSGCVYHVAKQWVHRPSGFSKADVYALVCRAAYLNGNKKGLAFICRGSPYWSTEYNDGLAFYYTGEILSKTAGTPYFLATHVCDSCGNSTLTHLKKMKMCSRCRATWYCGRKCQVAHWIEHKKVCESAVATL
jgi:hypothetical protein